MTALSAGLDAALAADLCTPFFAVEIVAPGYTLRLLDGSGQVTFAGKTFAGLDPTYGTLGDGGTVADGVDGEAPSATLTVLPPTTTAMAALGAVGVQGSAVSCWIGAVSAASGQVLGDPYLLFTGEVDVPTLKAGARLAVEFAVTSAWEGMFADNEGVRLTDAWHQSVWPGQTGLSGVTTVLQDVPWGADGPVPGAISQVAGAGGGGSLSPGPLNVLPV